MSKAKDPRQGRNFDDMPPEEVTSGVSPRSFSDAWKRWYGRTSGAARRFISSETAANLIWWHFTLLAPTLGFKYLYLKAVYDRTIWRFGFRSIVQSMGEDPYGLGRYVNFLLWASINVMEVSVLVGLLFVAARLMPRLGAKVLMIGSVFLCMLFMGINQYILWQSGNLLTADTLEICINWIRENPKDVLDHVGPLKIIFMVLAASWPFLIIAASRPVSPNGFLTGLRRYSYRLLLVLTVGGTLLGCVGLSKMTRNVPVHLRGYWSSALITFLRFDKPDLHTTRIPSITALKADYERLVQPLGSDPRPHCLIALPAERLVPRHILIVALETAPRKYYPLIDNPDLPAFYQMSKHAIVSDNHYAAYPYTFWSLASLVSGNYLMAGRSVRDYGDFEADSLPSILGRDGYTATYVDSFKINWNGGLAVWKNFGFVNVLDSSNDPIQGNVPFLASLDKERQSFSRALAAIIDAENGGKKALVILASAIGHYPWRSRPGEEDRPNAEKLYALARLFNDLFAELLESLEKHGLAQQVLIVVVGDHGFRVRSEFESVGERPYDVAMAFNVPLILYAPGIFESQIRLPYVTSHVDITPTLLALLGLHDDSWLHHGGNMLDERLRDRVTFMMNTNLSPVDGFYWNGSHYTVNNLTGQVQVRAGSVPGKPASSMSEEAAKAMMESASRLFEKSDAYFHRRKTSRSPREPLEQNHNMERPE